MAQIQFELSDEVQKQLEELFQQSARQVFKEVREKELHTKEYMKLKEACEYVGISYGTLQKWIREEDLKVIDVSGIKMIAKQTINTFLLEREQ